MLNLHLDDVKKQNIDFRKRIQESPANDQKTRGLIAEKKKF